MDTDTSSETMSLNQLNIIGPDYYQQRGYPHREWTYLRQHKPVYWYDGQYAKPFWAITKHADIIQIAKQPQLFTNRPRIVIFTDEQGGYGEQQEPPFRHLLTMDPPQHGEYRSIMSRRFTPRAVSDLRPKIERITRDVCDSIGGRSECDFVVDVAAKIPLAVIAELLGCPRKDWDQLFRWSNEIIGAGDPEFQRPGETQQQTAERARIELFQYFAAMMSERQKIPTDEVSSVVANATLPNGEAMPPMEMLGYYFLLVLAGNETTRNATSGGLQAFIDNPEQFARLKKDPSLIKSAVEEIVRWVTPVIHFARTASADTEVRGQKIRQGETVCLFYASANRDEEVFDRPFEFDIGRDPNPHIAFGIGEHFCLGANLARLELEVIFSELAKRLESAELAGPIERLRSSFVGGIKHMPIRFKMNATRS
ncbi:MAG: cytochrome P450 [Candidatus Binataceae bacterium]